MCSDCKDREEKIRNLENSLIILVKILKINKVISKLTYYKIKDNINNISTCIKCRKSGIAVLEDFQKRLCYDCSRKG